MSLDSGVVAVLVQVEVAQLGVAGAELPGVGPRAEADGGAGGVPGDGEAVEGGVGVVAAPHWLLAGGERVGDTDLALPAGHQVGLQVELGAGQGGLQGRVWARQ